MVPIGGTVIVENQEWQNWRAQELEGLGQLIAFAGEVFPTCDVGIEGSRHYGLALLAHGVETARAIRLCLRTNLPGPAFTLARALYETVLRGHVIVHEIGLKELNELLVRTQEWQERKPAEEAPPKIEFKGKRWRSVVPGKREDPDFGKLRALESETARLWQESVVGMRLLHDLTHGGMSQALQMVDEDRSLGAYHSVQNQTLLLYFSQRAVMFSIMTWPGAVEKYGHEIEQRARRAMGRASVWERQTKPRSQR